MQIDKAIASLPVYSSLILHTISMTIAVGANCDVVCSPRNMLRLIVEYYSSACLVK